MDISSENISSLKDLKEKKIASKLSTDLSNLEEKRVEILQHFIAWQLISQQEWFEELVKNLNDFSWKSSKIMNLVKKSVLLALEMDSYEKIDEALLKYRMELSIVWKINLIEYELLNFCAWEIDNLLFSIDKIPWNNKSKVAYLKDYSENMFLNNYLIKQPDYQNNYEKANQNLSFIFKVDTIHLIELLNSIGSWTLTKALCFWSKELMDLVKMYLSESAFDYLSFDINSYIQNNSWETPDFEIIFESIEILRQKAIELWMIKD